ncbi:hypothetical protein B0H34DRAFT_695526 [Crassisporium funariophilum]|nr:hypothetical protein B0H34DRAFT_695526 [Crassisporium funariophilum]
MAATCPPAYDWAKSSVGMTPCQVASALTVVCDQRQKALEPISPGSTYDGPTVKNQNMCSCSSVVYALTSGCADCQGGIFVGWADWSEDCGQAFPGFFPLGIPANVTVPQWAYFNPNTQPSFDPRLALQVATTPPVVTPPVISQTPPINTSQIEPPQGTSGLPTTEVSLTSIESLPPGSTKTSLPTQNAGFSLDPISGGTGTAGGADHPRNTDQSSVASASSSGSNTGAVAGGVVGGLFFLAILAGLVYWLVMRRRRARVAPSAAYIAAYGTVRPPTTMSHIPFGERSSTPLFASNSNSTYHDVETRGSAYSASRPQTAISDMGRTGTPNPFGR